VFIVEIAFSFPNESFFIVVMTASEILHIAVTVGICQICLDLFSNWWVYKGEKYKRSIGALERSRWKLNKAEADLKKNPKKNEKRHTRAKVNNAE
jgi:hypothetical protein